MAPESPRVPRPSSEPSATQAVAELVFAGILWGFAFIAAIWALKDFGPFTLTVWRLGAALLVSLPVLAAVPRYRAQLRADQLLLSFWPGVFLSLTLVLQTWGLRYTTATKSSFITCLYILFVPLLERALLKTAIPRFHLLFVAVALAGTALICDFHGGNWNVGDLLTLLCAVAATLQIVWFGRIAERIRSPFVFNTLQTGWALLLPLAVSLLFEAWPDPFAVTSRAWAGLGALSFGATLIAFMLQVRAQKVLSPSIASLLFLLESPFATLFAVSLLGESLSAAQWVGAGLILFSVSGATWSAALKPPTSRASGPGLESNEPRHRSRQA